MSNYQQNYEVARARWDQQEDQRERTFSRLIHRHGVLEFGEGSEQARNLHLNNDGSLNHATTETEAPLEQ